MDQVCAFGRRTVLLTFDGDRLDVAPVPVRGPLWLLVVDLRAGKDTRRILAELDACFPATPGETAARVRDALGPRNRALVTAARDAVAAGDGRRLGALMTEAQAVFDAQVAPACAELRAPRLHALLAHPAVRELAWGAKGVGSQGDGCAQIVTRDAEARDVLATRLEAEVGVACFALTLGG
jgi:galactokinase